MQRDGERHFPQDLIDEIGAAVVDETVDVFACERAHHRFMMRERFGRERVHQCAAARHVRGFVLVDERAVEREAVRCEHRIRFGAGRRDLLQRDRRTEREVVAEDRLDVVVARDDPVAEFRAEEHRLLFARPAHIVGRVLLIAVAEGIEFGCARAHRAAVRRARFVVKGTLGRGVRACHVGHACLRMVLIV